jgi:hypothetical protein
VDRRQPVTPLKWFASKAQTCESVRKTTSTHLYNRHSFEIRHVKVRSHDKLCDIRGTVIV